MTETKKKWILNNWSMVGDPNPYLAPECRSYHLQGYVSNHPNFEDGHGITTSRIVSMKDENIIITKSGSEYTLGTVDPEYERLYPNAQERLINSIKSKK
jgi:hypothetical protein